MYVEWTLIDYQKLFCIHNCKVVLPVVLYLGDVEPLKMSYKSALYEDMRYFEIVDRKTKDNCCVNTLKYWKLR